MNKLALKVPPLIVAITTALLMWLTALWLPQQNWEFRWWLFSLLMLMGGGVGLSGVLQFRSSKTSVSPTNPNKAETLVTKGIYQYTRNPMYLGMAIMLGAVACLLSNIVTLIWMIFYMIYITEFQIKPEEKILIEKFGNDFKSYMNSVRRWI